MPRDLQLLIEALALRLADRPDQRILDINQLTIVTGEVVEAHESLVIGVL
jgi:hypothetical protein